MKMKTGEKIEKTILELRGMISGLKLMIGSSSELSKVLKNAETELTGLEEQYLSAKSSGGDLTQIQAGIEIIYKALRLATDGQVDAQSIPKSRFERVVAVIRENATSFGILAVSIAFLFTLGAVAVTIGKMGASSWQTITGGRAVLLLALTFAFVTFGGALLIAPLFSEGSIEERFRRSREVFLLFAGMFTTVVGFYFASANQPFLGSELLIAETFDSHKGELQVAVAGGKPPYTIEVEYGEKAEVKKKAPEVLDTPGTVRFGFLKKTDWPKPMTIKVKDSADSQAARLVVLDKDELIAEGFKEPKKGSNSDQNAGDVILNLILSAKFDSATGTLEVTTKGGKPPYKVDAIYGKDNLKKSLPDVVASEGTTKLTFDRSTDWPSPLAISVKDSGGNRSDQAVDVDESLLTNGGFTKPQDL
jgi:hypothetical protein